MAGPIRIAILAQGSSARREMRATAAVGTSMGSSLSKAGRLAAAGIGVASVAAVALAKRTVTAASNAQQSLGATESVYGRYADTVIRRSEQAADAVGLSANEYRELANVSGAMLKSSELPLKRVTDLTAQLNRRAADVAATFGGTTRDAVEAFNALLRGETDPVERYGVAIKATDVSARLAAKGQEKLTGSALKQASALARLDLLFQQTKSSQGQFRRESDTLAGQQQRLGAEIENLEAKVGAVLLPTLTDLAIWTRREVVPVLEDAADWFEKNQDEISGMASAVGGELLQALRTLQPILEDGVELVQAGAEAWAGLPGPVKAVVTQVGLAAVVWPRFNAAASAANTTLVTTIANLQNAEKRSAALASTMRQAAGIGGVVALTSGLAENENSLGSWAKAVGGGAAAGAALGSVIPGVGTAIGAAGGAAIGAAGKFVTMKLRQDEAAASAESAEPTFADWASTLDQVTGAVTRNTRALALQELQSNGIISQAGALGITTRDLIGSMLGQEAAMRRVNGAMRGNTDILRGLSYEKLNSFLTENRSALRAQQNQLRLNNRDLLTWRQALRGLPPAVKTEIKQAGADISIRKVRDLAKQYKINPKRLTTRVEAAGVEITGRKVRSLQGDLKSLGKVKPSNQWLEQYSRDLTGAEQKTRRSAEDIRKELRDGTAKARADLNPFTNSVRTGTGPAKSAATTGGLQVGENLQSGMLSGFSGTAAALAAQAASAVRQAVAAARHAGDIHSPSRRMRDEVGKPLADGIVVGFLAGVRDGSSGISSALDKLLSLIEKKYDGKKQAVRRKALLKSLRDERAELVKNGRAQDKVNRLLEKAEQRYKSLRNRADDFAKSIRSGFQAYGSIVGLGTTGGGSDVTLPAILSQLTARAAIADQFAAVIASLRSKLNKTSLRQLLDQASSGDLEGALATAQAIASGGQGAIAQINALTAQITAAGEKLGEKMRRKFFGHGLEVADGVVKGLERRQRELDRIADRLAKEFLRQAGIGKAASTGTGSKRTVVVAPTARASALDTFTSTRTTATTTPIVTVQVELTAQQLSEIEKGRKIQVSLDAYHGAGGRAKVRTP